MKSIKPTLTLFCGLPGSGKTRIAKQLEQSTGAVRLCTDDWLTDIDADLFDEELRELMQQKLYDLAQELLSKHVDVVLEDRLWSKPERDEKLAMARKLNAFVSIHVFDLSPEEQWRRLEHRNQNLKHGHVPVTREQLDSYFPMFQAPTTDELKQFDEVHLYDDSKNLEIYPILRGGF